MKYCSSFLLSCLLLLLSVTGLAAGIPDVPMHHPDVAHVTFDIWGDQRIRDSNSDKRVFSAIGSQLLTLLVILREVESGNLNLSDSIEIPANVAPDPQAIRLEPKSFLPLRDLIQISLLLHSDDADKALKNAVGLNRFDSLRNKVLLDLDIGACIPITDRLLDCSLLDYGILLKNLLVLLSRADIALDTPSINVAGISFPSQLKMSRGRTSSLVYENLSPTTHIAFLFLGNHYLDPGSRTVFTIFSAPIAPSLATTRAARTLADCVERTETIPVLFENSVIDSIRVDDSNVEVLVPRTVFVTVAKNREAEDSKSKLKIILESFPDLVLPIAEGSLVGQIRVDLDGKTIKRSPLISGKTELAVMAADEEKTVSEEKINE